MRIRDIISAVSYTHLLKETVSADNQHRGGCFESYTAFDTDNCIAYVHILSLIHI